jgi:uncharacterized protein involved in high-affinity Fe2+ transport
MTDDPAKTASEEADQRQLDLAASEGEAYQRSLKYMIEEVAHTGAMKEAGDYVVGIAQEEAEGMYQLQDGELAFVEPTTENCHLEVAVADVADGRFVPHLSVTARLSAEDGETVGPVDVPFLWHPGLYHYGSNLTVPGDGTYDVRVQIDPPSFGRHDEQNGDRYGDPVEVTFEDVDVKCGQG